MKCEICHQADAQTAITRTANGEEEELYVCKSCAAEERRTRQKKSQRTRKAGGLPPGVSITVSGGGDSPPPIIGAILGAMNERVSDLETAKKVAREERKPKTHAFPLSRIDMRYRIRDHIHLEGLHLVGDLDSVKRAMHALRMELVGVDADGIKTTGHVFRLDYTGSTEQAKRVVADLMEQERNARVRLFEELPRVFGDSLCRALAILKNCRLLSPGELFDLLSPLRLAALEDMLDGVTLDDIDALLATQDLSGSEDRLTQAERDKVDAERADEVNARFEDVVLNERAEGRLS